jgi:hypothetical protein
MPVQQSDLNFYEITKHYLSNSSELNLFNILYDTDEREYSLNIFRNYVINDKVSGTLMYYLTHEVDDSDFPDTIATKYYNNPFLWWVVCLMNDVVNPFEELTLGRNLKILKFNYLYQLLSEVSMIGKM